MIKRFLKVQKLERPSYLVCKKQYKQESDLMNHMKSHIIVTNAEPDEDEPILECAMCDHVAQTEDELAQHIDNDHQTYENIVDHSNGTTNDTANNKPKFRCCHRFFQKSI